MTNKHGIYRLPHELPNDLKLKGFIRFSHGIFTTGGAMPTQEKKIVQGGQTLVRSLEIS